MRIMGKLDRLLTKKEYTEFFERMGYKDVCVGLVADGEVEIMICGGRLRPPKKADIAKFNQSKILGTCYTVKRMVWVFGRRVQLWSNRNWDVD